MFKLNNTDAWLDVEKFTVTCTYDIISGLSVSIESRISKFLLLVQKLVDAAHFQGQI